MDDVIAVLDRLRIDNAPYMGYAMGRRIGFGWKMKRAFFIALPGKWA